MQSATLEPSVRCISTQTAAPSAVLSRIPTLDGWRGVAILFVLISHTAYGAGKPTSPWTGLGLHGVGFFFVLSGYLITSRLLSEGRANLTKFYMRRFFRLMPVAWTYLVTIFALKVFFHKEIIGSDVFTCLLFCRNYNFANIVPYTFTGHFWSLSIEEQFYLAWPFILVFLGNRRALWVSVGLGLICAAYRLTYWDRYNHPDLNLHTEVHIDALLIGCTVALLLKDCRIRACLIRYSTPIVLGAAPILIWQICHYTFLIPSQNRSQSLY